MLTTILVDIQAIYFLERVVMTPTPQPPPSGSATWLHYKAVPMSCNRDEEFSSRRKIKINVDPRTEKVNTNRTIFS